MKRWKLSFVRKALFVLTIVILVSGTENQLLSTGKIFTKSGKAEYWAVIVGIADYKGRELDLLPHSNLSYLYTSIMKAENWNATHVVLLINESATRNAILQSLDWLKENVKPDDIVLFSYQGHGYELNGQVGIVPWEGLEGFISVNELDEKFDQINAKGMCLIFDCCLSGNFVSKRSPKKLGKVSLMEFSKKAMSGVEGDGRVVLMSTMRGGLDIALEITSNDKVIFSAFPFTWFLSKAFEKGYDINKDEIVSAEEAFLFAKIRMLPLGIFMLNPIWQLKAFIITGHPILPFPQIYDGYKGWLPIVLK